MKNTLLVFFLLIVAVLSFLMIRNLEKDLEIVDESTKISEVLVSYNVKARYFGVDSQLEYVINSDKVIDLSNNAGTNFESPHVNYFENKLLQWTVVAKKGYLTADKNELTLFENVNFVDNPQGKRPLLVKSSVMYYYALTHMISSDRLSVINNGIVRQESVGFSLDTITKVIDFHETVKGRYKAALQP